MFVCLVIQLYDVVDGLPREEGADADAEQDRGDVKCLALGTDPSVRGCWQRCLNSWIVILSCVRST